MTSSETRRQEALDIVYSALSNPDASGNRFLSQLMNNAKDGYFSLNLLKGLVTELKDYPLAYLQHCISYQQRHHPNQSQLELGHDESQVRISRRDGNITPVTEPETDPFGFLIKHSSSTTTEETGEKRPSSPATELSTTSASSASEIHPPLPKKQRRSSGTYFTPYRPSFNFTALAEDEGSLDLLPVFYADGKFFQDDSFFNASKAEKATKTIPFYNKLEALPIGMDQVKDVQTGSLIKEKTCWNCGSPGHEIPKCPIPIDRQRVETNRAIHSTNNGFSGGGRYYEELVYKDRVSGLEPGRLSAHLRDALGMYNYEDDPPYYRAMRKHGYPPGYTGTYADQERVMKLVSGNQLDEDVPDLKIFDLDCDGEDGDKDKSAEQDQNGTEAPQERVRMVTYPGLYRTQEMTGYVHQTSNDQQASRHQTPYVRQGSNHRQKPYHQQQQQYYQQTSYQQQQQQHHGQHQHQHQSFSPYSQHHLESSPSNYYHQPYYTPYDYHGYQQTYHQFDPASAYYYNEQQIPPYGVYNNQIPPPPIPSQGSIDYILPPPTPSHDIDDDIPPPPPLHNIDDDIPPPPPPLNIDDDIPPPPPSHNIDNGIPPPPPSHNVDGDIPPPPPSNNMDDGIPPPPPSHNVDGDIPPPPASHTIHDVIPPPPP